MAHAGAEGPPTLSPALRPSNTHLRDDEEVIPGLPLNHDLLSILELHGLQGVRHSQALPFLQGL